jgi:hypothetical protein
MRHSENEEEKKAFAGSLVAEEGLHGLKGKGTDYKGHA